MFQLIIYRKQIKMYQGNQNSKSFLQHDFEEKLQNIDKIAQLAIQSKQKKISQKYGKIQSTSKILKNLITQFTKKSIKLEQDLTAKAKIHDLQYQTQYHEKRIESCLKLSSDIDTLINEKRRNIQSYQQQAIRVKQELILVKTQNIKKIMKIEMQQKILLQKQVKQSHSTKLNIMRLKSSQNQPVKVSSNTIQLLKKQKNELTCTLWQKITNKIDISKCLFQNYIQLKQKLIKQQKKSNIYGLTGTLLFKLQQNQIQSKKIGLPISRKNKIDQKLLIYDVLKQKYSMEIKNNNLNDKSIKIQKEQFMKFTPLQILGLIQLKGGIGFFRNKKQDQQLFDTVKTMNQTTGKEFNTTKFNKENFITTKINKDNFNMTKISKDNFNMTEISKNFNMTKLEANFNLTQLKNFNHLKTYF